MKCFGCNKYDFKIKHFSFEGLPCVECPHCKRTYFIKDALHLVLVDLPVNCEVGVSTSEFLKLSDCPKCGAERYGLVDSNTPYCKYCLTDNNN